MFVRSFEATSSRAMIQLGKQAALCRPISLGTKNKLQRRRKGQLAISITMASWKACFKPIDYWISPTQRPLPGDPYIFSQIKVFNQTE